MQSAAFVVMFFGFAFLDLNFVAGKRFLPCDVTTPTRAKGRVDFKKE